MAKKRFLEVEAVNGNISFSLARFQKLAIAGETGSGKSTLLKIIGGLAQAKQGNVFFEEVRVLGAEEKLIPGHAGIVYLSQHFELPTHLRVSQVLEYANQLKEKDATLLYEVCAISHLLDRKTHELSGGEKQRIALAKLLVTAPRLLLLDEPFSNLDMIHKGTLKSVIRDISEKLKISTILVSHDPLDTLPWADEIIVMKDAGVVQHAPAREIYRYPVNEYVAGLFGKYNQLPVADWAKELKKWQAPLNGEEVLFIRPERFYLAAEARLSIKGIVTCVLFMGSYVDLEVAIEDKLIIVRTTETTVNEGDSVRIALA